MRKAVTLFSVFVFVFVFVIVGSLPAGAIANNLMPRPKHVVLHGRKCMKTGGVMHISDATHSVLLQQVLNDAGFNVVLDNPENNRETHKYSNSKSLTTTVTLVDAIRSADGAVAYDYPLAGYDNEAYHLSVTERGIAIEAVSRLGVIRAAQTLAQLAQGGNGKIECCDIIDWPAFKLRGMMHDVGRSFIDYEKIKQQVMLMAKFKVNTFHWHMTENQAWRFEVKAFPQLTSAESMTRLAGKYYTQEQCRELDSIAYALGVTIIPEIDMPGHSEAFKRAMGHSMQSDEGVAELKQVLNEVAACFPHSPYIHIGGDEETITYPRFLETLISHVHSLGRKCVVWNPINGVTITKDLGIDMTQMWSTRGKKVEGVPNIDCRYNYTNHFDLFADVVGIFKSNIYYQQQGDAEVAGFITCTWNDRQLPTEDDIMRQNNVWANLLASNERAWTGGGERYIEEGGTVLPVEGKEYEEFADWERRFIYHKHSTLASQSIAYVLQSQMVWHVSEPEYGERVVRGAGTYLRHTWGGVVPGVYGDATMGRTAYAWTTIYSPKDQTVGALIEFQNYSRSEKDPAPEPGCWDMKGSRVWVNGEEVMAPAWQNAGKAITNETMLLDENCTARKPTPIHLVKGWNRVLIKLPYEPTRCRLNKWMWSFAIE